MPREGVVSVLMKHKNGLRKRQKQFLNMSQYSCIFKGNTVLKINFYSDICNWLIFNVYGCIVNISKFYYIKSEK